MEAKKQTIEVGGVALPLLTGDEASWKGSSLLSATQISTEGLKLLFQWTLQLKDVVQKEGGETSLQHKIVGTVFYEASTRTACSFKAAAMRLGANNIHVDSEGNNSLKKGETLEDTIRCLECYTDLIVLRHPQTGSVSRVIQFAEKPILNAGDGVGEHPTQALLDVFTIYDELIVQSKPKSTLTVVLLGDLKNGRTVHSLARLLCATRGILWQDQLILRYCAPNGLELPVDVQDYCNHCDGNIVQENFASLPEASRNADVLYVTRIQQERFESNEAYERVKGSYVVDAEYMKEAPAEMIVLHPLPRVDEIATDVDSDPRAAYFRQMENGMYVRMALLSLILG